MSVEETSEVIDFSSLMRADQALAWLTPLVGSRTAAKAEIADLMRDGLIEVFARRAWDTTVRNTITAWQTPPDEDDEFTALQFDINVAPRVWRGSADWLGDQGDWRWPSGRFTVAHQSKPWRRIMIEHVHFDPAEIKRFADSHVIRGNLLSRPLPLARNVEPPQSSKPDDTMFEGKNKEGTTRGRHTRGKAWARAFEELIRLRDAGQLSKTHFKGRKHLIWHFTNLSKDPAYKLGEDAITPMIAELVRTGTIAK